MNTLHESLFSGGKLRIRYFGPNPSWHQRKAGSWTSGILEVEHTYAEHVRYMQLNPDDTYTHENTRIQ